MARHLADSAGYSEIKVRIMLGLPNLLYTDLKAKGLLKKYSVNDYVQLLTDLQKIKINGYWQFNEVTKDSSRMVGKTGS